MLLLPRIQQIQVDAQTKTDTVENWLQPTINEIGKAWEWDFVLYETLYTGGSVSGTAQYALEGAFSDALEIITIKYGDDENVLKKMHPIDMDEYLHNRSHSSTDFWVPDGRQNGFPLVRLVATPDENGTQIKYRYRKRNISITEFPDDFMRTVALGIARNLDENLNGLYEDALEFMIDNYRATQVHERTVQLDPRLVASNNWKSSMHGYE